MHSLDDKKRIVQSAASFRYFAFSLFSDRIPAKGGAETVRKCLLEGNNTQHIVYFIDPIDFGNGTQIEIIKEIVVPLVSKRDFKILKREEYQHDTKFISKLIKNKTLN
ncbi:uncharacterized protein VICG_00754 [Vittaforma corneae ATCC 50505]|uniref:Uncharacterized protein n=1 Tax=Vittaforma corneae (strain ATCC 50505) TaxID=993615 RepID=L2GMK4_VITCO|nr:uncharacterized protein VICG_00754 [Vittaforma corneae ATCC 50505]ELA42113.1 hypothetical protein VICG_00754 [Vittaforma corneae ATCC 50505]